MSMTILEFSRAIGVSTATVWRAINGAKGISPGLQAHVAQRLKDEAEVDKQRDRAREARKLRAKGANEQK